MELLNIAITKPSLNIKCDRNFSQGSMSYRWQTPDPPWYMDKPFYYRGNVKQCLAKPPSKQRFFSIWVNDSEEEISFWPIYHLWVGRSLKQRSFLLISFVIRKDDDFCPPMPSVMELFPWQPVSIFIMTMNYIYILRYGGWINIKMSSYQHKKIPSWI